MAHTVLIIDDDEDVRYALRMWLRGEGYIVLEAGDGKTALEKARQQPDIVLLDYHLPDTNGMQVLRELASQPNSPVVIMITAFGTIEMAVEAMRLGAFHFLTKPWNNDDLAARLQAASELVSLRIANEEHRASEAERYGMDTIIGESPAIMKLKSDARKVAQTDTTVLIVGETGTGKEVFARAIHLLSRRAGHEFIPVNCAAIPENLLESELFGYEPGAFTDAKKRKIGRIERAHKGTLFLDEIGDMPLPLQAKILRVLEDRKIMRLGSSVDIDVDVRIIAATHRKLEQLIEEGRFREDLYYRLDRFRMVVPPVRERGDDVLLLAKHFISIHCRELHRHVTQISPEAAALIRAYHWPGNVRQIDTFMERILISYDDIDTIDVRHLPEEIRNLNRSSSPSARNGGFRPIPLEQLEREHILATLEFTKDHRQNAAALLGISRKTLKRKLDAWSKSSN